MRNFATLLVLALALSSCATPAVKPLGEEVEVMDPSETKTGEVTLDSSNTTAGIEPGVDDEEVSTKVTPKKKKVVTGKISTTKKK